MKEVCVCVCVCVWRSPLASKMSAENAGSKKHGTIEKKHAVENYFSRDFNYLNKNKQKKENLLSEFNTHRTGPSNVINYTFRRNEV